MLVDPSVIALARAIHEAGAKGVDEANQEILALETNLTSLGTAHEQGKLKITEYAHECERLRVQIERLKSALAAAKTETETAVTHPPVVNSTARRDGPTLMQLGLQDQGAADREASRLANALESSGYNTILRAAERGANALRLSVETALAKAGVSSHDLDDFTTRVTDKLSAWVDNNVKGRASPMRSLDTEARAERPNEAIEPTPNPNSQSEQPSASTATAMHTIDSKVISSKQYLDRMLVAGFSKPTEQDKIAARQLDEQKNTNKKLDGLTKAVMDRNRQGDVARFARGRT
ncbi:hypothetical protein SAMN05444166_0278 [Singulisphaera sp. GP187]|uniref:hypothetical protein n=1 Tax=Singulisphaera sp. GP187 TaxID=1882752 RepID=UPI000926DE16|nr:hypothetical protein [Singulisphaera sp. GP187]SIN70603.1 hypothetical protein SAMN05444166_0278 [Singulisphaera sp. GP187]